MGTFFRSIGLPEGCPPEPRPRESGCFPSRSHTDGRDCVTVGDVDVGTTDDVTAGIVVVAEDIGC